MNIPDAPAFSFGNSKRVLFEQELKACAAPRPKLPVYNRSFVRESPQPILPSSSYSNMPIYKDKAPTQAPILPTTRYSRSKSPIERLNETAGFVQILPEAPSWSFGKTERTSGKNIINPAPGSYKPLIRQNTQAYSLGFSKRETWAYLRNKDVPGPGSYKTDSSPESGGYTFRSRPHESRPVTPGPSNYSPNISVLKSAPRPVIGSSTRLSKSKNITPGVGSYNLRLKAAELGYSLARAKRYGDLSKGEPGPGSYNIPSTIGKKTF